MNRVISKDFIERELNQSIESEQECLLYNAIVLEIANRLDIEGLIQIITDFCKDKGMHIIEKNAPYQAATLIQRAVNYRINTYLNKLNR